MNRSEPEKELGLSRSDDAEFLGHESKLSNWESFVHLHTTLLTDRSPSRLKRRFRGGRLCLTNRREQVPKIHSSVL